MAKRRKSGLVPPVRVSLRLQKAHEHTLEYMAEMSGMSVAEHVRRAVDIELRRRFGAPVRIYVDERQGLDGYIAVTLTEVQREALKRWPGGNVGDHMRRAIEAYIAESEHEIFRFQQYADGSITPEDATTQRRTAAPRTPPQPSAPHIAQNTWGAHRVAEARPQSNPAQAPGPQRVVPMYEAPKPGDPRPPKPAVPPNLPPEVKFDK